MKYLVMVFPVQMCYTIFCVSRQAMENVEDKMIQAIVNADDFGISEEVNQAICLCFDKRIITNTTLMVNMPYADHAVILAKERGFAERVGLHLNLTAGMPLTTKIRSFRLFCNSDGSFNAKFHLATTKRLHIGREESEAVQEEIEAQIRKYLSFGLPEKHIDSHHHAHTDWSVLKELIPLLHKYSFRSIRIGRNMYERASLFHVQYKKMYNKKLKGLNMKTADYFGSYRDFTAFYDRIPDNALAEIMLHPLFSKDGILMDAKTPMSEVKVFLDSKDLMLHAY